MIVFEKILKGPWLSKRQLFQNGFANPILSLISPSIVRLSLIHLFIKFRN